MKGSPLTSTWPHLRRDVALEERQCLYIAVLCTIIIYEQFLEVGRLYWSLILLGLALYLPSASVSLIFMVLY